MSNNLSAQLLGQLFSQESNDPLLALVTLSHPSFSDIHLVNNQENIVSNGTTFNSFPMKITFPTDDGERVRELGMEFDNVGLDLLDEIRTVTTPINVKIEMVLASIPDDIQMVFEELKIQNITYTKTKISARLFMDSFLNTEISSEKYLPTIYPGIF
jgi:hypothetical protein